MPSRFPLYVVIQILRTFLSEDRVYLSQIKKAMTPAWWTEKVHWGFFSYFVLYFFIFWNGVSLCNWLPWNSLCRPPGWSAIHKEPVLPDLLELKSAPPMSESLTGSLVTQAAASLKSSTWHGLQLWKPASLVPLVQCVCSQLRHGTASSFPVTFYCLYSLRKESCESCKTHVLKSGFWISWICEPFLWEGMFQSGVNNYTRRRNVALQSEGGYREENPDYQTSNQTRHWQDLQNERWLHSVFFCFKSRRFLTKWYLC